MERVVVDVIDDDDCLWLTFVDRNFVFDVFFSNLCDTKVYEGAVYMNQGKTYLVKELNLSSMIAVCQRADVKYYTKTRDYTDIDVVGGELVCSLSSVLNLFKFHSYSLQLEHFKRPC